MSDVKKSPEFGVGFEIRTDGGEAIRREVVTENYAQAKIVAAFGGGMWNALGYHVRYLCFHNGWIDDKGVSFSPVDEVKPFQELPDLETMLRLSK
jgi:hypothetical protein